MQLRLIYLDGFDSNLITAIVLFGWFMSKQEACGKPFSRLLRVGQGKWSISKFAGRRSTLVGRGGLRSIFVNYFPGPSESYEKIPKPGWPTEV